MAGASYVARRFPVRIGRSLKSELRLEEEGVWDQHLTLELRGTEGCSLKTQPNALARVNGQPFAETWLRNGDTIEIGAVRIQFWFTQVRQRSLYLREALSWSAIGAVFLGQLALLYWLLR
jgi:hypothetical protein